MTEADGQGTGAGAASRRLAGRGASSDRSASGRATAGGPGSSVAGEDAVTYRGVRWERNPAGRLRWHDDDQDRWMLWKRGQDAPPRPPGWVPDGPPASSPLRDKRARAGWRSPYRLVPVVLVVAVVIIGTFQAVRTPPPPGPGADKAAAKLLGRCLVIAGSAGGQPIYEAGAVACKSKRASVKVVRVLPGAMATPQCPRASSSVRLAAPGVRSPPVLCVAPIHPPSP